MESTISGLGFLGFRVIHEECQGTLLAAIQASTAPGKKFQVQGVRFRQG